MRSVDWFSGNTKDSYIHRAWMRRGNPDSAFTGTRPQIAILNTASVVLYGATGVIGG